MSRSFRVYQKKRGHRRTGSRSLGRLGELVFFGLFFFAGCFGIVLLVVAELFPQWRVNHEFVPSRCVVLGKQISRLNESDDAYRPEIRIEYEAAGRKYATTTYDIDVALDRNSSYSSGRAEKQAALERFKIAATYPCWYDPLDHGTAVLVRGYSLAAWLLLAVPTAFVLIGGGGFLYRLLYWGKSAERRAASALGGDMFEPRERAAGVLPNVPTAADMTNSPGTRLRFRLPISTSATWALVSIGAFCVIWNGIVVGMAYFVWGDVAAPGPVAWIPLAVLVPFALVGIFLIGLFCRQLLITTGVGQTFVEISDHPLYPGTRYELLVSQAGRLRMNRFSVLLACEETVTFRQGTNTRTESKCVFRKELFCREHFSIQHGLPMEARCDVEIPEAAMHSFKSPHNEINWKIVVAGDVYRWSDYQRDFPVIVYPHRPAGACSEDAST